MKNLKCDKNFSNAFQQLIRISYEAEKGFYGFTIKISKTFQPQKF